MQAGTKQEGLSHGVSLWPNCLLAPWRRGPLPRECWCLRLTWPFPKPELSPECSASSLMGPRSSLHFPSSSGSHTLPSREVSSSHVPSISPLTHTYMFLMCSLQSTAWRLPLVFTSALPCCHLSSGPLLDTKVTDKEARGPREDKWRAFVWTADIRVIRHPVCLVAVWF